MNQNGQARSGKSEGEGDSVPLESCDTQPSLLRQDREGVAKGGWAGWMDAFLEKS